MLNSVHNDLNCLYIDLNLHSVSSLFKGVALQGILVSEFGTLEHQIPS